MRTLCVLACVLFTACASSRHDVPAAAPAPKTDKPAAEKSAPAKTGVCAPANAVPWSYWPEEWSGQLLVLEITPHGSPVREGDVVARFDTRQIDDQIRNADLELRSAQVKHAGLVERHRIDEEAARSSLAQAQSGLDRAKRALAGWKERDLEFSRRDDELAQRREQSSLEDQRDELGQLEEMYNRDELVDGTEEIVLKRARRQLALTESAVSLSRDRARKRFELDQALELEQREEAVRVQGEALDRLKRSQEIERKSRQDAEARSAEQLAEQEAKLARLRRDREALAVTAARTGFLLHGPAKDWRPGRTPPRHERGSTLAARAEFLCVADHAVREVRLELQAADLAAWKDGARARARTPAGAELPGKLRVDPWPRGDGGFDAALVLDEPAESLMVGTRCDVTLGAPAP